MTQKERILAMLQRHPDGVCGRQLLGEFIPRYAARVYELRQNGYQIESKPCDDCKFDRYRLVTQPALF